jgi:hypothetical protein
MISQLRSLFENDPILVVALAAALVAFATTPLAFAVLARMEWFQARRGRVMRRPSFVAVVIGMLLVMSIPAIFSALALKSRYFDKDRYEFDPNRTLSVLDQGRQYRTLEEADAAVRAERERLDNTSKNLLNAVKKFDESFLALRSAALQHPATYQALPGVLNQLAEIHKSVGLDAPQQLMNLTAPPAAIAASVPPPGAVAVAMPAAGTPAPAAATAPAAVATAAGGGISQAEADAEIATVPDPQKVVAGQLPLTDVPAGWVLVKDGPKHIETFNAENLYEKIDGRAESFIPYKVVGAAYCNYHPDKDDSVEVQLFVFDMTDAIHAFGKYASEKPDEVEAVAIGKEGYTAAGSVFFYSGRYYTQVSVSNEDPKTAAFALEIAKKVAAKQQPKADAGGTPETAEAGSPDAIFKLLPAGPGRSGDKYLSQDVFGYSFLESVFEADYKDEKVTWQGFIRPYADPAEAAKMFDKYVSSLKGFGAQVKPLECPDAEKMVVCNLDGLLDVVFLKGNSLAGVNGATALPKAEAFTRAFAKELPRSVAAFAPPKEDAEKKPAEGAEGGGDSSENN